MLSAIVIVRSYKKNKGRKIKMATATVTISYTRDFQIQLDDSLTPEQIQKECYNNAFNFMAELLEHYNFGADDFTYKIEAN